MAESNSPQVEAPVPDWNDTATRERAMKNATRLCEIAFKDRLGHGSGPASYRQMRPDELTAMLVVAFEAGAKWESNR